MVQQQVIDFLKKAKEPKALGEIIEGIGNCNKRKVTRAIKKLLIYEEIECIEIDRFQAMERCGCKRRMRLYYV